VVNATVDEFVSDWSKGTKGSVDKYKRRIARVTEAPGAKAAAAGEKARQKIAEAFEPGGKWEKHVADVSLSEWKDAASTKGARNIPSGVDGAQAKMRKVGAKLLPAVGEAQGIVEGMSSTTYEDMKARSNAYMDAMHAKKGTLGARD